MKKQRIIAIALLAVFALPILFYAYQSLFGGKSHSDDTTTPPAEVALNPAPAFNADSAFGFVKGQVDFGPRIPNTKAHTNCGNWLVAQLKKYGCQVTEQTFKATTFDGTTLNARNIIGSINPQANKRILLAAHWDTRPFADKDTGEFKDKKFDGADDGASGVGVLLEIARTLQANAQKPNVGVDIIFFDAEDWGEKHTMTPSQHKLFWCLGSQYWAKNPHKVGYRADYGILLDMVGAKGAIFPKEGTSMMYASGIVENVWQIAQRLGYDNLFNYQQSGGLTDDHTPVNETAKIPMIDIVNLNPMTGDFGSYHHRHTDNLANIDRNTLKAVGQVVVQVLYQE